ncbi:hypothetical protein F5Y10DRAFT_265772 [Nemania abortiva]|nr:hypothetical protein F5Y10DRAFT_265772 [Nemania abortiva]
MSADRKLDSLQGEFSSRVPHSEPLEKKGYNPDVLVENDRIPEFQAQTHLPGTAPRGSIFQPHPEGEYPAQTWNATPSTGGTIESSTPQDVNLGIGRPIQGQGTREIKKHHGDYSGTEGVEFAGVRDAEGVDFDLTSHQSSEPDIQSLQTTTLLNDLRCAMVRADGPDKWFIPNNQLNHILNRHSIKNEIATLFSEKSPEEQDELVYHICGRKKDPQSKRCRKIFALLLLINQARSISQFIAQDVSDTDIPLESGDPKNVPNITALRRKHDSTSTQIRLDGWAGPNYRNFLDYQRLVNAPFFTKDTSYQDKMRIMEEQTIMPWIPDDDLKNKNFQITHSKVRAIRIHEGHHDFKIPYSVFALKTLHRGDLNTLVPEIEAVRRFSPKDETHLVQLLTTFYWNNDCYFLFPWAYGGSLEHLWQTNSNSSLSRDVITWISDQCHGVATGLHQIHEFKLSRSLAERESQVAPGEIEFILHGYIKPTNILWFKDPQDPLGVGTLKLSDFGLDRFHSRETGMISGLGGLDGYSPTYRSPESELKTESPDGQKRTNSQPTDIWGLGCVYLEFVTWILLGYEAIDDFAANRADDDQPESRGVSYNEDVFFQVEAGMPDKPRRAVVKDSVVAWLEKLHCHPNCTLYLHEFLDLIQKHMLVVTMNDRAKSGLVKDELGRILTRCRSESYYTFNNSNEPEPEISKALVGEVVEPGSSTRPMTIPESIGVSHESQRPRVDLNKFIGSPSPSTVFSSSLGALTKGTIKSHPTAQTSMPSGLSHDGFQKSFEETSAGIQEEEPQVAMGTQVQPTSTEELPQPDDNISFISQGSTEYPPHQKNDAISMFAQAMLKRLPENFSYTTDNETSRRRLLHHLRMSLKAFAAAVEIDPANDVHRQGIRIIRRLRQEIASKVHDEVIKQNQDIDSSRDRIHSIGNLPPITMEEKVRRWKIDPAPRQDRPGATSEFTSLESPSDTGSNSSNTIRAQNNTDSALIDPHAADALDYFTSQSAFDNLIHETERLFERYHDQKMDLIRQRTSLALRRHAGENRKFSAYFSLNWMLAKFLTDNYDAGIYQKLDHILATTGGSPTARMCTVGEYMAWCWPSYSTQLLDFIGTVLRSNYNEQGWYRTCASETTVDVPTSQFIAANSTLSIFEVEGTEDFIISIAQQLSWLAAVCQEKSKTLTHAYVGFWQATSLPPVKFEIDVNIETPSSLEDGSCWNRVVGPAVVVNGFPLPERQPEDRGLEVSIPVMVSLARLSPELTFEDGFVFKGRHHGLVPTGSSNESIQWHFIDTYPKRLRWSDIDKLCPVRLRGYVDEHFFLQKRSFLGWCPRVIELLGTDRFGYDSVLHSKANTRSRQPQLDKLTLGFSQWGQITAEISLGQEYGVSRPNDPDDYEVLLNDAKSMHVILHDTTHRRAYQTNAEELILNIIHHRKKLDPQRMNNLEFADVDRSTKGTRQVMHSNSEKVLHTRVQVSSPAPKEYRFKKEVKRLYEILDRLWENDYDRKSKSLQLGLPSKTSVSGWEYMEVVRNCKRLSPRMIDLRNTCGRWNDYAKDIRALVLFGANFGDVLKPACSDTVCSNFSSLPSDGCYLAVRVDVLEDLFNQQGSLKDQAKLTPSGYTLDASKRFYGPCNNVRHQNGGPCTSRHVLRVVKRSVPGAILIPLKLGGAVIIGEMRTSLFQSILNRE